MDVIGGVEGRILTMAEDVVRRAAPARKPLVTEHFGEWEDVYAVSVLAFGPLLIWGAPRALERPR